MAKASIETWHIVLSGWLQNEGQATGTARLWWELYQSFVGAQTAVIFREWNVDVSNLAEKIWRFQNEKSPVICVYAYSWSGQTAVNLARALQRRGMGVKALVLSDPVYRHRYCFGNWRAYWPLSKIRVPSNVREVWWFLQRESWPRGHRVVAEDARLTLVHEPEVLSLAHSWMDDARRFHQKCHEVAKGTVA